MLFMLDNYDSFTFNLYQAFRELGTEVRVVRNDQITVDEVEAELDSIDGLVVSPGPCTPREAGISVELIQRLAGRRPILGVCLGHQAIGAAFGARIVHAPSLMHGKTSLIRHREEGVFAGLPSPFTATRYHSLTIDPGSLPAELDVTAMADDVIMGVRHRELPIEGVQFHPESILTVHGKDLLRNFVQQTTSTQVTDREPALIGY
ncbi:MAG: aminodeoxychorismate/anthranilate synthase component II [Chloroflexota bacterium]|nr:aminodeoxychorismate/anthranilate synthase component II [Chloroflexota bacterium]